MAGTPVHAHRMGPGWQSRLFHLLLLLPPTAGAILFLLRSQDHVFHDGDPDCLATHIQPVGPAPIHWQPGNGLEARLVGSHGFILWQYVVVRARLVAAAPQGQSIAVVGIGSPAR